ncbi:FUSC family protein [Arthrobacter psychrolactophilus]|uniref:FUSC family protein n=1 Tax=Arthrobacter psychrolactophilus TaxID=92442 RepID=A0A2V5IM18_9MICC|nr:FUSC family protein [Arthrobacter psychrolactophilus]PYI37161.1 FUSC family protein [Arthrobacter psychrolactophilus]
MTPSTRFRHSGTALAHSLSPAAWRGAFHMRPADAIFTTAIKVGIAATIVLVAGGLMGQPQLAGMAALGALTSAFGRYQPYRRLGRMMAIVGVGMIVAITIGVLLGAAGVPMVLQILVLSLLAGLASHVFTAFRISGPGAVILVFAAGVGSGYAHSFTDMALPIVAMAIGVVVGWFAAMAPALWVPLAPSRLAVARGISAVIALESDDAGSRTAAAAALRSARGSVTISAGTLNENSSRSRRLHQHAEQLHLLLDDAEATLALFQTSGSGSRGDALARLGRHKSELRKVRGIPMLSIQVPAPDNAVISSRGTAPQGFLSTARGEFAARSSIHQALRMALAAALSGWVAVALGLEHPLWATMGAIAALQGLNYAVTVQRSIQRLVGNVVGAAIAVVILSLSLGFWPSVVLVIAFQVVAELLVLKNYTLTTIAVTPMALIMTGLGSHLGPDAALSRVADTLIGVVIGTLVAALSISLADRHHLPTKP